MHRHVGIGGAALAAALAVGIAGATGALADEPPPDPTTPPVYTPSPGTVPATTLPAQPTPSARLTLLSSRRLVLDARRLRTTLEVRCGSSATGRCDANGQLFVTLRGRRVQIGKWAGKIPGQRIATPRFTLTQQIRALPRGRAIQARLRLTNVAHTTRDVRRTRAIAAATQPITTVVTLPVTILLPRPQLQPPAVTTGPASGITPPGMTGISGPGTAVAAGVVDPRGDDTTYHFEFGPAAGAYDHTVPATDRTLDGDGVEHLVTATLTPLEGGFPVHYRVVAANGGGTTFGADKQFSVPLVLPASTGAPVGDTTIAGPVMPQVTGNICVSTLGVMISGADLICTINTINTQPPVVPVGNQVFSVRPANLVLAVQAPGGMIGKQTQSPMEPVPVTLPPSTGLTSQVSFQIVHPPVVGIPEITQIAFVPPSLASMPSFAHPSLTADVDCSTTAKSVQAGATVTCTATVRNGGTDNADLQTFEMTPTAALRALDTTDGDPPAILKGPLAGGGAPVTVTERFQVLSGARSGAPAGVDLLLTGRDETDRAVFSKSASDHHLLVG